LIGSEALFYEIEIEVCHGSEWHSLTEKGYIKKFRLFSKDDLIEYAKCETDSAIINQLNHFYKDCQFNFLQAYRKYGQVFYGTARVKNRITGKSEEVYHVEWNKDHWNLNLHQYKLEKLNV
jgi:hypothetical protein